MNFTAYLRQIGRGKDGARPLDREQAEDLLRQVYAGQVNAVQLGAFAMSGDVLRWVRNSARVIHVGKRGGGRRGPGRPSTPQVFIERLMIADTEAHSIV